MTHNANEPNSWNQLFKIGGYAAIAVVCIIPIQILIFSVFPPPSNVVGFFELFNQNWILGLLSLDLLYLVNNAIIIILYLALFAALRKTHFAYMLIAITIGLVGITTYYSSSVAFEMMSLSNQYFTTENLEIKQQMLAAGQSMLVTYKGTAFDVYYILNAVTLLLISRVMLMDKTFSRSTAIWGLISGVLMLIPSTAGTLGLIFSLLSLIPWIVFSILIAIRLFKLAKADK